MMRRGSWVVAVLVGTTALAGCVSNSGDFCEVTAERRVFPPGMATVPLDDAALKERHRMRQALESPGEGQSFPCAWPLAEVATLAVEFSDAAHVQPAFGGTPLQADWTLNVTWQGQGYQVTLENIGHGD